MSAPSEIAATPRQALQSWVLIVAAVAYAGLLAAGGRLLGDPDTYWHLATGRWSIEHAQVPTVDPFSHTLAGAPWHAHEWLAELVLWATYELAGWSGVVVLAAAAAALALALLTRFLLQRLAPLHALAFVAVAFLLGSQHLLARPHTLALPLVVLWAGTLFAALDRGRAPPLLLLPVMTLWANLHGGFTFGLALTGCAAAEAVLAAEDRAARVGAVRRWGSFGLLALAAGLITPHGLDGLLFTVRLLGMGGALTNIGEWQPPDFHRLQGLELWLLAALGIAFTTGLRLPPLRTLLLLLLVHLALKHVRHAELLGLVAPLVLAKPIADQVYGRVAASQSHGLDLIMERLSRPARPLGVTVMICGLLTLTTALARGVTLTPPPAISPAAAVEAASSAGAAGSPVLNDYNFGGYLIWRGIPPFIDGRVDMYGEAFVSAYLDAVSLRRPGALDGLLTRHRIGWTLLDPGSPAVALLDRMPGWRRLYTDAIAVVHIRAD
jgi:hypothetical protein